MPGCAMLFGSQDDRLYALESNGHSAGRWSWSATSTARRSLGRDGTIYVGSDDRKLYALR